MPKSSVIEDDPQSCATMCVQSAEQSRENFFTVSDAPRQLESASGYLALYFGTYVISSLFIFIFWFREDGTAGLYFAVVTLTTAGLGDFVPTTDANKIICSIHLFGVACIGLLLGLYIAGMLTMPIAAKAKQINAQIVLGFKRLEKRPR
jgi:hypothetical protein